MTLYFAYGANLDRVGMADRCPASIPLGIARLDGYRFIIMAAGYATVLPAYGHVVYGLLWKTAAPDLVALDDYEEVDGGLYRRTVHPVSWKDNVHQAELYVAASTTRGAPRPGYMEQVLSAAEDCGLPDVYRAELGTWLDPC